MKKIYALLILCVSLSAQEVYAQACTGTPASNVAVASSTAFCVGTTATLSLQNAYTQTGIVYQWAYSTGGATGPWTAINGANNATLATTALTLATYYTAVIGCTNSFLSTTATAIYVNIMSPIATTNTPYYESFEAPTNNGLPHCAWAASSLGQNCISFAGPIPGAIPCSGSRMLGFSYSVSALGTHEFFTQGFNLQPAVVYSLATWQTASYYFAANNWSQFGMGIGTTQSAATSTLLYSTNNPIVGPCSLRSATFSVPSAGVYYFRIFATAVAGTTVAPYLTFDELTVTTPCNLQSNSASATIVPSSSVICAGNTVTFNITPAPNCTVSVGNTQTISPQTTSIYSVGVTNTVTGCVGSSSVLVIVSPIPNQLALANPASICVGRSSNISLIGPSNTFTLYPGGLTYTNGASVSPTISTTYTLVSSLQSSCSASPTLAVNVLPSPTIILSSTLATICKGENYTVSASGANQFVEGNNQFTSTLTLPVLTRDSVFVVTGTNQNGCQNSATLTMKVSECAGIHTVAGGSDFAIFPNPNTGVFKIVVAQNASLKIRDVSGRLVYTSELKAGSNLIQQKDLSRGLYVIEVQTDTGLQKKQLIIE